jgi:phosphatidate cytidylyltransferase
MPRELLLRLTLGPLLAAAVLGTVVWSWQIAHPGPVLGVLALIAFLAARELVPLLLVFAPGLVTLPLVLLAPALALAPWFERQIPGGLPMSELLLALGIGWAGLRRVQRAGLVGVNAHLGASACALLYAGVLPGAVTQLVLAGEARAPGQGYALLILTLAATKLCDTGAFFGGKLFGRHRMAPRISPGKTWEGFASGILFAIAGTWLCTWLLGRAGASLFDTAWEKILWGGVIGSAGVLGDLLESLLKRGAAAKDSGSSVPGFGGVLDILDAVLISAPVAAVLAALLLG